jgi:hypothetical protein
MIQSRTDQVASPEKLGYIFEGIEIDSSGLQFAEVAHGLYAFELAGQVQKHQLGACSTDGLESSYEM